MLTRRALAILLCAVMLPGPIPAAFAADKDAAKKGGQVAGIGVIVDRSGGQRPDYGCPFMSLVEMNVETFPADKIPADRLVRYLS